MRSKLAPVNLPTSVWGEALLTAVYILTWVPSKALEKAPHELWIDKKPFLGHEKFEVV